MTNNIAKNPQPPESSERKRDWLINRDLPKRMNFVIMWTVPLTQSHYDS